MNTMECNAAEIYQLEATKAEMQMGKPTEYANHEKSMFKDIDKGTLLLIRPVLAHQRRNQLLDARFRSRQAFRLCT